MAEYADVPQGFRVASKPPQQFSDVPQGFAVSAQGAPAQREFVGPRQPQFGAKDYAIGAGDLLVSGARALVNKPATTLAGLVGAVNPNDTYVAARDRERERIASDRYMVRDERLRTPQGQTLASIMGMLPKTEAQLALSLPGEIGERVGGEAGRDVAESALMLGTLRLPKLSTETPRTAPTPRRAPTAPPRVEPPAIEDLRAAKNDAYTSAENAGVIISKDAMARIARDIKQEMAEKGIDANLHPDSLAALNRLIKAGDEHTTLKGADILRQVIKDAADSTEPRDARLASIMRDAFDEHLENLSPNDVLAGQSGFAIQSLLNARQLNTRLRKAEDIQELFRRAELKAGANYTAAGIETALRQEFRALAMNRRRMRGFTAEERSAIEHVAKGGAMENATRLLGKFAISGAVSGAVSTGLGYMFGGPLGAIALPAAGYAAKNQAARMTVRNAQNVSEMVRRGPENSLARRPTSNALTRR